MGFAKDCDSMVNRKHPSTVSIPVIEMQIAGFVSPN